MSNLGSLQLLQALGSYAKTSASTSTSKSSSEDESDSFAAVYAQVEKAQEEWDEQMEQLDLMQYKYAMMDSFWADDSKSSNYLFNYALRQQKKNNQSAINSLVQNITSLQQKQWQYAATGVIDAETAASYTKQLSSVLQTTMMMGVMNSSLDFFSGSSSSGYFF